MSSRVRLFRSLWGCLEGDVKRRFPTLPSLLQELKGLGYEGIEASLTDLGEDRVARQRAAQAVSDAGMGLILGCYSSWQDYEHDRDDHYAPPERHLHRLQEQVTMALDLGPVHVNCHSGSDAWGREECVGFFQRAVECSDTLGQKQGTHTGVSHETHRGRPLGHPFTAYHIGQRVPSLRLTADVSHWFLLTERLLHLPTSLQSPIEADEGEGGQGARGVEGRLMQWAAHATDHVHARVGTPQAPQVWSLDGPSAHVQEAVRAHTHFWSMALDAHLERATVCPAQPRHLTLTPEYGPNPYTPLCPSPSGPVPANDHWALTNAAAGHLITALRAHQMKKRP